MYSKQFALLTAVMVSVHLQMTSFCDAQQTSTFPPTRFTCPSGLDGLFPDQTNCSQYFECQSGQLTYIHQCPRGLYWLATGVGVGYCVVQSQAQCRTLSSDYPQQPGSGGQIGTPSFVCPLYLTCNRTSLNGFYGDPTNCSRYYLCVDGRASPLSCPSGMTWSDKYGYCDWPYKTGCDPSRPPARNSLYQCNNYNTASHRNFDSAGHFRMIWIIVLNAVCSIVIGRLRRFP
jgi:hypothetical protein